MLPIASQTAGPNGLKFLVGGRGFIGKKIEFFFLIFSKGSYKSRIKTEKCEEITLKLKEES